MFIVGSQHFLVQIRHNAEFAPELCESQNHHPIVEVGDFDFEVEV